MSHPQPDTSKTMLGFWVYLMTDCVLFATLFATFAVLRNATAGGPSGSELFSLPFVLLETIILLVSSLTVGLGLLAARSGKKPRSLAYLFITILLGILFLGLELSEFAKLVQEGHGWQRSAFLSAFFTLVGTHGLHITAGLIWMVTLVVQILRNGISSVNLHRLTMMAMFWHFLDVVWIFIFTIVYLFGVAI